MSQIRGHGVQINLETGSVIGIYRSAKSAARTNKPIGCSLKYIAHPNLFLKMGYPLNTFPNSS
jgi:hypothetical protein